VPINGQTINQAFAAVASEEGYENGHSYSGDFGSKDGPPIVVATIPASAAELHVLAGSLWDALWAQDGEGLPAQTPEALALLAKVTPGLDRTLRIMDDKWGQPAAIVGTDHVLFIGMCSE
jgi:hypothetical protein